MSKRALSDCTLCFTDYTDIDGQVLRGAAFGCEAGEDPEHAHYDPWIALKQSHMAQYQAHEAQQRRHKRRCGHPMPVRMWQNTQLLVVPRPQGDTRQETEKVTAGLRALVARLHLKLRPVDEKKLTYVAVTDTEHRAQCKACLQRELHEGLKAVYSAEEVGRIEMWMQRARDGGALTRSLDRFD